jgi:Flp pilus assembly protein TadG
VGRSSAGAKRAISRWRDEAGQAVVLSAVWMVVLLGMAGLVIDVGSWYRDQRNLQSDADAAALAGAQELPDDTASAGVMAQSYATKNGYSLTASGIAFSGVTVPNDSITIKVKAPSPTFFTKLFGINSVDVAAKATAKNDLIGDAKYVAPITVNIKHPLLSGKNCPCFDTPTTLPLSKLEMPGAFGLLDLDNGKGNGSSMLGSWIRWGYDGFLPLGDYSSNTGAKFSSAQVQDALDARMNSVLLFPVYDTLTGNGTNGTYHVIAWVAFYLTGYDISGNNGTLSGHFTDITWQGIPATANNGEPNLGARVVTLTN